MKTSGYKMIEKYERKENQRKVPYLAKNRGKKL